MRERVVDLEILIQRPAEDIFRALIDPEEVKLWWRSPEFYQVTEFRLDGKTGGKWFLAAVAEDGKPFEVRGDVIEYDPPNVLSFSWNPTWQKMTTTNVRITLTSSSQGTLVRLEHSGFQRDSTGYEPHLYGWPHVLRWLLTYLES